MPESHELTCVCARGLRRSGGDPETFDTEAGEWTVTVAGVEKTVRVPWIGRVSNRPSIRVEVVALCTAAYERLGIEPTGH